jgi:hypothetical protein
MSKCVNLSTLTEKEIRKNIVLTMKDMNRISCVLHFRNDAMKEDSRFVDECVETANLAIKVVSGPFNCDTQPRYEFFRRIIVSTIQSAIPAFSSQNL